MPHIVDLSHRLIPGKQRFPLSIKRYSVEEYLPDYKTPKDGWYIMENVEFCTHIGTHVEAPYHALRDGVKVADIDVRRFFGMAAIVDFTDKGSQDPISQAEMIERGRHITADDIVLIKTGLSKYYGTSQYKRPYVERDTIDWLIDQQIKCLGIDCSGIENRKIESGEINHRKLFSAGIPLIEDLNNLEKLHESRVFFMALPLPIEELDASVIRPLAIEPPAIGEQLANVFLSADAVWEGAKQE